MCVITIFVQQKHTYLPVRNTNNLFDKLTTNTYRIYLKS